MNVFNFYINGFLSEVSQLKFVKQFLLIAMKILMQWLVDFDCQYRKIHALEI